MQLDELVADASSSGRAARRLTIVAFETDLEPTLVRGEPDRIARAVTNLLDNARKWSPDGSTVEVKLRDGPLTVRDHGPGFDDADLPHVFDRFYRAKAARGMPGSGLGLAIVRQIGRGPRRQRGGGQRARRRRADAGALRPELLASSSVRLSAVFGSPP